MGNIRSAFIWAALDRPGGYAVSETVRERMKHSVVLGGMATKILGSIQSGEQCVIVGWPISVDGRKNLAGTTLYSGQGTLIGLARATWISIET
jgi:hypothetical protein